MMKKYLFLIFIILVSFTKFESLFSEDKMSEENSPYGEWFVWKYENTFDPEQKKVITYFKNINQLVAKATATEEKTKESAWEDSNPKKTYKMVTHLIGVATQINPPPLCKKHYDLSLKILRSVASYQKMRADLGGAEFSIKRERDQLFEEKIHGDQLEQFKLREEASKEFYIVLRKTGFYDNSIEEMSNLKLITPEQKAEFEKLSKEDEE